MKMTGEQKIAAPRERVWAALNDPDILRRSIPGCQSLEIEADGRMRAVVEVKIGPIGARFNGVVSISDAKPPASYTITGEGQGGTVGSAKGGAKVQLSEDSGGTLLSYDVDAQVGGRLAQLGGPIIDATAKQLAAKFFRQFGEAVAPAPAAVPDTATPGQPAPVVARSAPVGSLSAPVARQSDRGSGWPVAWLFAILSAGLIGFLVGGGHGGSDGSEWIGLSIGLLVVIVAAAAFEFGRRTPAPVVILDSSFLDRLSRGEGS